MREVALSPAELSSVKVPEGYTVMGLPNATEPPVPAIVTPAAIDQAACRCWWSEPVKVSVPVPILVTLIWAAVAGAAVVKMPLKVVLPPLKPTDTVGATATLLVTLPRPMSEPKTCCRPVHVDAQPLAIHTSDIAGKLALEAMTVPELMYVGPV